MDFSYKLLLNWVGFTFFVRSIRDIDSKRNGEKVSCDSDCDLCIYVMDESIYAFSSRLKSFALSLHKNTNWLILFFKWFAQNDVCWRYVGVWAREIPWLKRTKQFHLHLRLIHDLLANSSYLASQIKHFALQKQIIDVPRMHNAFFAHFFRVCQIQQI